jgi:hypothetical protein
MCGHILACARRGVCKPQTRLPLCPAAGILASMQNERAQHHAAPNPGALPHTVVPAPTSQPAEAAPKPVSILRQLQPSQTQPPARAAERRASDNSKAKSMLLATQSRPIFSARGSTAGSKAASGGGGGSSKAGGGGGGTVYTSSQRASSRASNSVSMGSSSGSTTVRARNMVPLRRARPSESSSVTVGEAPRKKARPTVKLLGSIGKVSSWKGRQLARGDGAVGGIKAAAKKNPLEKKNTQDASDAIFDFGDDLCCCYC